MKNIFPREHRLTTEAQFKYVFNKKQQKITDKTLVIYCCHNDCGFPRLGVIVPKRNIRKASKRNYFKRIVREYFRLNQSKMKQIDMVVIVNREAEKPSKKEMNLHLAEQFKKIEK